MAGQNIVTCINSTVTDTQFWFNVFIFKIIFKTLFQLQISSFSNVIYLVILTRRRRRRLVIGSFTLRRKRGVFAGFMNLKYFQ